ncbi:hypothetical protein [Paenibacillus jiagnxiensis]|uniref:hypothetical protein n=1 Tax=Paenibacillus jiagnxiensis TaxID=3228926 RepID=UPI0033A719A0
MIDDNVWQLTEFSNLLEGHYTTVNGWFNSLEKNRVHYVSRLQDGKRVYDEMDLKIGVYIKSKRSEKWSLEAIFAQLPKESDIELRPFPEDFKEGAELSTELVNQVATMMRQELEYVLQLQEDRFTQKVKEITEANTVRALESRQKEITDRITLNRVRTTLRIEALEEWGKLPASERMIKTGLFRKEEDSVKREKFIAYYELEHLDARLVEAYGLDN